MATSRVSVFQPPQAIASLRESDFDTCSALGEVIDNSLQAGAKHIRLQTKDTELKAQGRRPAGTKRVIEFALGDDGSGMDRDTLHQCLQLGFSTRYNDRSGIGRFGVGMTLAAINQCRRIEVFSRNDSKLPWLHTYVDLDQIAKDTDSSFIADPSEEALPPEYKDLVGSTGTLVVWKKCDRLDGDLKEIAHWLGRTYRKFISPTVVSSGAITPNPIQKEIHLNGHRISPFDPLYVLRDDPGATLFPVIEVEVPVPRELGDDGQVSVVSIQMSLLPEDWRTEQGAGGSDFAKQNRIPENEGFSILRSGREVFYDSMPHFKPTTDPDGIDRWWSAEISFEPILDLYFSVKNIKRGARFVKDFREKIEAKMRPTILDVRRIVREKFKQAKLARAAGSGSSTEHAEAEAIAKKVNLPLAKAGARNAAADNEVAAREFLREVLSTEENLASWCAKIESQPCTIVDSEGSKWKGATFLDIHPQGGRTVIAYNRGHVFFQFVYAAIKVLSESKDPAEITTQAHKLKVSMDLLFMAYAQAEAQLDPTANQPVEDTLVFLMNNWGMFLNRYVKELERQG